MSDLPEIPTSRQATEPPIAMADLLRRCMGKVDFANRMLARFEETFAVQIVELQALPVDTADDIARVAHRMKGAAANVGADRLSSKLNALSELAEQTNNEAIQESIDLVVACWNETRDFMKTASFEGASQ